MWSRPLSTHSHTGWHTLTLLMLQRIHFFIYLFFFLERTSPCKPKHQQWWNNKGKGLVSSDTEKECLSEVMWHNRCFKATKRARNIKADTHAVVLFFDLTLFNKFFGIKACLMATVFDKPLFNLPLPFDAGFFSFFRWNIVCVVFFPPAYFAYL